MNYFKMTTDGFIDGIGTSSSYGNISKEEYDKISALIHNIPKDAPSGYGYRLRADNLEWELCELPVVEEAEDENEDEEATTEDYEAALAELGVK